jgi:activator of 2-hydroxyglutaryl-CoA dehydratase
MVDEETLEPAELEIMARTLGFTLDEFGPEALKGEKEIQVSSMCTVFAESEVTPLVAKGADRHDIALALHHSVARRAAGMVKRVSVEQPMLFAGGVARNPCMRYLIGEALRMEILVPRNLPMVGALGAAFRCEERG